jgi:hypothetical protein
MIKRLFPQRRNQDLGKERYVLLYVPCCTVVSINCRILALTIGGMLKMIYSRVFFVVGAQCEARYIHRSRVHLGDR